jgi:transcriptional regulator with XRE-family HTH domain
MNKHEGSTLESLFEELGELEEVEARAAKKVLSIQAERRMKELGLSTTILASRMRTSRNQVHRILDQEDAGITLKMLFRLAQALQLPLIVTLGTSGRRVEPSAARAARRGKAARPGVAAPSRGAKRSVRRAVAAE